MYIIFDLSYSFLCDISIKTSIFLSMLRQYLNYISSDNISVKYTNTVDTPNSVISNPNRCSYIWN